MFVARTGIGRSIRENEVIVDADASRDAVMASAKAQIASSDAFLRAGHELIASTKIALTENRRRYAAGLLDGLRSGACNDR